MPWRKNERNPHRSARMAYTNRLVASVTGDSDEIDNEKSFTTKKKKKNNIVCKVTQRRAVKIEYRAGF